MTIKPKAKQKFASWQPLPPFRKSSNQTFDANADNKVGNIGKIKHNSQQVKKNQTRNADSTSPTAKLRRSWIAVLFQRAFNLLRRRSVLTGIQLVLLLQLERPVLTRLTPALLMFLVNTCVEGKARPKVLRIVGMELDRRVHKEIMKFTHKDHYELGDITKEALHRYTGKDHYELGDVTKETIHKLLIAQENYKLGDITRFVATRVAGEEFVKNYQFGDCTKTVLGKLAGKSKDDYHFGDVSKAILAKLSGQDQYEFGDITRGLLQEVKVQQEQQHLLKPSQRHKKKTAEYLAHVDRQFLHLDRQLNYGTSHSE